MVIAGFFAVPLSAEAHKNQVGVVVESPVVVAWVWAPGHFVYPGIWVRGYWFHSTHGKSYRAHRHGPPPAHVIIPPNKHKHKPRHYHRGHKRR